MRNPLDFFWVILGVALAETGGISIIRQSHKFSNPARVKTLARLVCILGIIALIVSVGGLWFHVW